MHKITRNITLGLFGLLLGLGSISFLNSVSVSAASLPVTTMAATPAVDPATGCLTTYSASKCDACKGLTQVDASQDCGTNGSGVGGIVKAIVGILSYIVGVAAVVMVILGGFKYVTSAGDSGRISSAKNTLVYALVGLAIAALAQFLVHFVLSASSDAANPTACPYVIKDASGKAIKGLATGDTLCSKP
jgi:hypothetical protein